MMKPETAKVPKVNINIIDSQTKHSVRKSLHVLQHAAGKADTLVGPGRNLASDEKENMVSLKLEKEKVNEKTVELENAKNKVKKKCLDDKCIQTEPVITKEDLTSEDGPSENYWEVVAERRRIALEETLEENQILCEKNRILGEENETYKSLLQEAKNLVQILTELLEEKGSTS